MKEEYTEKEIHEYADEYILESLHQGIDDGALAALIESHPNAVKSLLRDFLLYFLIAENFKGV